MEGVGTAAALFGGRAGVGGEGAFSSSFSATSLSSVALRSAIRSAMRVSRSLSSSSCRDSKKKTKTFNESQSRTTVVLACLMQLATLATVS